MSYQAEERYWTDYLRIALPIAGLLLLLGVFWYWASTFIGDEDDNDPQTPVAQVVNTPVTAPTFTPTVGAQQTVGAVTVAPTQEAEAPAPTEEAAAQPTEEAAAPEEGEDGGETTDPGGETGSFVEGDLVVTNDNDVNLRAEPSLEGEIVSTLIVGEELRILSEETVDADGYTWWNVSYEIGGTEGWVASTLIEPME